MQRAAFFIFILCLIGGGTFAQTPPEIAPPTLRAQHLPVALGLPFNPQRLEALLVKAHAMKLDSSKEWVRLLHDHKTWTGGWKSQAGGPLFFLSSDGRTNPSAELDATLTSFFTPYKISDPALEQAPRCALPARFHFLQTQLHFQDSETPKADCHRFEEFQNKISAKSATLIFSSYYLNNPSSTFGHTLLRLNHSLLPKSSGVLTVDTEEDEARGRELLDYGVNYAANATTRNPLLFAFNGFFGFFQGVFTAVPYYYKVREYNDSESRDLWEYDLSLTEQEIAQLVRHAWELGSAYFDYFYLTQNCSYHIFTLIEAAAPRISLTARLPNLYVIPSDTVKVAVQTPGFVTAIHYRPSVRSIFFKRASELTTDQQADVLRLMKEPSAAVLANEDPAKRMQILDAAADYVDYKFYEKLVEKDPVATSKKYELLVERSRLPGFTKLNLRPPLDVAPHTGHPSSRLQLGYGNQSTDGHFVDFGIRFALHDLLDPSQGYPDAASIEFLNLSGRWNSDIGNVKLTKFSFMDVISLSPITRFNAQVSWRGGILGYENWDGRCIGCFTTTAHIGAGPTFSLFGQMHALIYAMLDGEVAISGGFNDSPYRLGLGPSLGLRLRFLPNLISLTEYRYRRYWIGPTTDDQIWSSSLRVGLADQWALDLSGTLSFYNQTGEFSALYYF